MADYEIGQEVTCAETGKRFVIEAQGCSFNCARRPDGSFVSDEGVDKSQRRALLDRSRPFVCYMASDGKQVGGWKGNVLGQIISTNIVALTRWSYVHGSTIRSVRVRDVHGGLWYGRGSPGVAITLRAYKGRA